MGRPQQPGADSVVLGRVITEADDKSAEPVAVLRHRYWQRQFGANPSAIGQTITLSTQSAVMLGERVAVSGSVKLRVPE